LEINFIRATIEDVETLINVQNKSFFSDYIKYGECPGYNRSKQSMKNSVLNGFTYKIICDGKIVGDIIARDNGGNTYFLGSLCIIPSYENKGIGQEAIRFIESKFPSATKWNLETPVDKKRNHYFYKKVGYRIIKEYMDGNVKIVLFEKKIK